MVGDLRRPKLFKARIWDDSCGFLANAAHGKKTHAACCFQDIAYCTLSSAACDLNKKGTESKKPNPIRILEMLHRQL